MEVHETRSLYLDPPGAYVWLTLEASEKDGGFLDLRLEGGEDEVNCGLTTKGVHLSFENPEALFSMARGLAVLVKEAHERGLLDAARARMALTAAKEKERKEKKAAP